MPEKSSGALTGGPSIMASRWAMRGRCLPLALTPVTTPPMRSKPASRRPTHTAPLAARAAPWPTWCCTRCTSRASMLHRPAASAARQLRRHGPPRVHRALQTTRGQHPVAATRPLHAVDEVHLAPLGLTTTGATTASASLPRPALRPGGPPARPEPRQCRVPRHGRCAARGRHRGGARRGLQPHARGRELGPTCSFGGWTTAVGTACADEPSRYENHSGCGNVLQVHHPRVTQFVLDSLRYWVEVMGVDGFRFDPRPRWAARRSALTRRRPSSPRSSRTRCWLAST